MTINPTCHISQAAQTLGKKWVLEITYYLREQKRFCELQDSVGAINPATLSSRLKELEKDEIIHRFEIIGVPRHVEYTLTQKGRELIPIMYTLADWVQKWHGDDISLIDGERITVEEIDG